MSLFKFAIRGGTQLEQNVDNTTYNQIIADKNSIATDVTSREQISARIANVNQPINIAQTQAEDALILGNQQGGGNILLIEDDDFGLITSGVTLNPTQRRIYFNITGDTDFQTFGVEFTMPDPDDCFDNMTYMFHSEYNISGITPYVYFNDAYNNLNFDPSGTTIDAYCPLKIQYWQGIDRWVNVLTCIGGGVGPVGPAGTSGTSGFSGSSGTSGAQGIAGTSGTSGLSGTSGTSGLSGTSGTSGVSGTSGTSGSRGAVGETGSPGAPGTSGTSGVAGTSGTSGASGTSGVSGTSGTSGVSGTSGTSGDAGTNCCCFNYYYATSTPTASFFSYSGTTLTINYTDADSNDLENYIGSMGIGTYIVIGDCEFSVTSVPTLSGSNYSMTVSALNVCSTFDLETLYPVCFYPVGKAGSSGTSGTSGA